MPLQTLFFLYLLFHFLAFLFFVNRIFIRQHLRWYEVLSSSGFFIVQAAILLGLVRAWDFTPEGFLGLPWLWKAWCAAVAALVLWTWVDYLAWRFLRYRPVRFRSIADKTVRHPLRPPMDWFRALGIRNQIYDLHAVTFEVFLPDWPAAFDGLTVVQLSDIHHYRFLNPEYLHMAYEVARRLAPDLYVFTGDFVAFDKDLPREMAWLKGLKSPLGTYAVLGNHDYWSDVEAVKRCLKGAKIRILQNEAVKIRRKGRTLALMGVDDYWVGERGMGRLYGVKADAKLLLAHQPDHLHLAKRLKVNLQLSGHTHGGQICFPLVGPLVVPTDGGRRYAAGFLREEDTVLFVSRGVGAFPPVRYRCPPEVVKLVLRTDRP